VALTTEDFHVFSTYRDVAGHAFSDRIVTEADKGSYQRIFDRLQEAVDGAVSRSPAPEGLSTWKCRFHRNGGIQGQRPVDLWASIINSDSNEFSRFPQIYVIASEIGIELGFAVTIHESDYHNQAVKRKNRSVVPMINSKLPGPDHPIAVEIDGRLGGAGWLFGEKNRQGPVSTFADFPSLLNFLKSGQSSNRGGGSVYRILSFVEVAEDATRLEDELFEALSIFRPLMDVLRPTAAEASMAASLKQIASFAEQIAPYDPASDDEVKKRIEKSIAIRQGQGKFRDDLLQAYGSTCAISGCPVIFTLQAAHISPCKGLKANHVTNGLPLRADIHTLFDLGLIRIDPDLRTVQIAASLKGTDYEKFDGKKIAEPANPSHRPSQAALLKKVELCAPL
jgi:hypothetical protein